MKRYVIERDIPGVGALTLAQRREAARRSNAVLHQLGPEIQWVHSYVAEDTMFCIYLATSKDLIYKHAELSGFPATRVTETRRMMDPTTAATIGFTATKSDRKVA